MRAVLTLAAKAIDVNVLFTLWSLTFERNMTSTVVVMYSMYL